MNEVALTSNDHFVWTNDNPDVELIEPKILASIDKNWLVFGKQVDRPPQSQTLLIINHGDHPLAFKIHTSDNYAYFVSQVFGVVQGYRLFSLPHVRTRNSVAITIYRRPTKCFKVDDEYPNIQRTELPRKDRLFIYLAPIFSWTTEPASLFNHTMPYEKLRVCLEYTAQPLDDTRVCSSLNERWIGWNTWKNQGGSQRRLVHEVCGPLADHQYLGHENSDGKNVADNKEKSADRRKGAPSKTTTKSVTPTCTTTSTNKSTTPSAN